MESDTRTGAMAGMEQGNIMRADEINYGLSEDDVYNSAIAILRQFFNGIYVRGNQSSPLPEPTKNFIVLTLNNSKTKSLPSTRYQSDGVSGSSFTRRTQLSTFQLDIYGKDAMTVRDRIVVLGQSVGSYDYQSEHTIKVNIVTITDRGRFPIVNEQANYENRYIIDIEFSLFNEIEQKVNFVQTINVKTIEVK